MPRGNGTGPNGMGPRTGRNAGFCAGYSVPGHANQVFNRGFRSKGRGFGRSGGFGNFNHRNFFYSQWNYPDYPNQYQMTKDEELELLKNQANILKENMDSINKRMDELSQAEKQK